MACRTTREKRDLVRIVRTPDGRVTFDPTGRLAGRGAYLCADGSCWKTALAKHQISRALQAPLPDDVRVALESGAITTRQLTTEGGSVGQE